jgi:hypothetical protein
MRTTRCKIDQANAAKQTNIKQINNIAQRQRHHLVALLAQMSKDTFKTERPANRAFLLNETQEQNSRR